MLASFLTAQPVLPSQRPVQHATGLPAARVEFGLANSPTDLGWMSGSGVPWKYRYQYLSAGVNTGSGWETWNSPAGQFAVNYMNDSDSINAIPVFTYYEILQSNPSPGNDFTNLNNTATMNAYYANFALLMQKAAAFGKPVVVHVEPDLFGFMEQQAAGGDASTLTTSVASSGYAGVSGLPNTFQGYCYALLKLRDTIAPNVIMALHASPWASGVDIGQNTDPNFNMTANADTVAAFLNSCGVASNPFGSTWDAVFNDVSDNDAALNGRWWDRTDTTLPDFAQWLVWMKELHVKTGKQMAVWQVPVGNQYFDTMNNSAGHTQDNRAEYFLSHVPALSAAGIVAVMFGSGGNGGGTYTDAQGDGITNPAPISTYECNLCNNHTSVWSDDDGGFLRIFVGNYYAGLSTCATVSAPGSPSSPQPVGTPVSFTATATGCPHPLYEFWVEAPGSSTWVDKQPYSATATFNWSTGSLPAGKYSFSIWTRDASSAGISGNSLGRWDAYTNSTFTLSSTSSPCASVVGTSSPLGTATVGTPVTISGSASGCNSPLYQFWMLAPGSTTWQDVQPYSSTASLSWPTTGLVSGTYNFSVWARDSSSTGTAGNSLGRWDAYAAVQYNLTTVYCTSVGVNSSPSGTAATGTPVSITGTGSGCSSPRYEFWMLAPGGAWQDVLPYGLNNTFHWVTTGLAAGTYNFSVWVRDATSAGKVGNSLGRWDAYMAITYTLTSTPCTGLTVTTSPVGTTGVGTPVTITGTGTGCPAPLYEFWILTPGSSTWQVARGYGASIFIWATAGKANGVYHFDVWVRDTSSAGTAGNTLGRWDAYTVFQYSLT